MTEQMTLSHVAGKNLIKQLASNLYTDPKSAIKEAITNGLDQYVGLNVNPLIYIKAEWGSDSPLIIGDHATGIIDIKQFTHVGEGQKVVAGRVSSYEHIDSDIGGNKGFGKIGFLQLAGGTDPRIIFRSHRPETDKYNALGLIVTMRPVWDRGIIYEEVKSTIALEHQGCEVQIPDVKWNLLGRETTVKDYIRRIFALRIKNNRTCIRWNREVLDKPNDFDPVPYDLFPLSNGDMIKGNIRREQKPESKNIWIYCKNIGVKGLSFENKCTGWINDNLITPIMSREDFEDTERWKEIQVKLQDYLDEKYEKPNRPRELKMGKEQEKMDIIVDMLQYQDELLQGEYNKNGIQGIITSGTDKHKWTKKKDKLTNTDGGDGTPIIPIGPSTRRHGIRKDGTGEDNSSENDGSHSVLGLSGDSDKQKMGPVKPNIRIIASYVGTNKVPCYMSDSNTIVFNTAYPQASKAFEDRKDGWKYIFIPLAAEAILNRDLSFIGTANIEQYRLRVAEYIKRKLDN